MHTLYAFDNQSKKLLAYEDFMLLFSPQFETFNDADVTRIIEIDERIGYGYAAQWKQLFKENQQSGLRWLITLAAAGRNIKRTSATNIEWVDKSTMALSLTPSGDSYQLHVTLSPADSDWVWLMCTYGMRHYYKKFSTSVGTLIERGHQSETATFAPIPVFSESASISVTF